jgi:hypothetical protein
MMDVQQAITLGIVAVAGTTLVRRVWRSVSSKDGGHCAGCGECGRPPRPDVRPAPKATPLVTLGTGSRSRPQAPKPGA